MSLPYGDVDVAAAATARPAALPARGGPGRHDAARLRRHHHPGALLAERLPQRPGHPERRARLDDPAHRRHVRRPRHPALADTEGHRVVVTSTAAGRGRPRPGQPHLDHGDAAAAAVGGRGAVPPRRPGAAHDGRPARLEPLRPAAARSSAASTPAGSTSPRCARVSQAAGPTNVVGATLRYPKWQEDAELDQPNFDSADAADPAAASPCRTCSPSTTWSPAPSPTRPSAPCPTPPAPGPSRTAPRPTPRGCGSTNRLGEVQRRGPARGHALQLERAVPGDHRATTSTSR